MVFLSWILLRVYAEKGVPDFWLNAMKNNEVLAEEVVIYFIICGSSFTWYFCRLMTNKVVCPGFWNQISERDEGALKYLKDIKWCRIDNPKGFKLEFFFDSNPFFKNTVLTKTYHMIDEDEPILEKAIG